MAARRLEFEAPPNAIKVLESRYLLRNEAGEIVETPTELFGRVAKTIAQLESKARRRFFEERYFEMMVSRRFLPNTPTLVNAGRPRGQLSACFVLPVGDSLSEIFDALKNAALIHQSGGGTGFSFSKLRPRGGIVHSSGGLASGPVSFIELFDAAADTVKQGGVRRGANMGVLRVDHPDIFDFIETKSRDETRVTNFNLSVGITDEFMRALRNDGRVVLRNPTTGEQINDVMASSIFREIAEAAWRSGDPGLVFLDRTNLFNPTPARGVFECTNPCGEQPLLDFESCNLGSLNLLSYARSEQEHDKSFAWDQFRTDIHLAVRFLDAVIDANDYPLKESERITRANRKIGLGVMGFADLLVEQGIQYGSDDSIECAERVMSFLDREAKLASMKLSREKGAFSSFEKSMWKRLGYPQMRNATVSTVAPTGTISLIAGVSSGIEPIFAESIGRNVLSGMRLESVHPYVQRRLARVRKTLADFSTKRELRDFLGSRWRVAEDVSVREHIAIQAAFQRHCDSAVSKTINLPQSATVEDVEKAYLLAYEMGCKGITVYRDQSKSKQVLDSGVCKVC